MKLTGFGCQLRQLRQERNVSISMISQYTGIARSSIYRWEKEDSAPKSLRNVRAIANFFGMQPSCFIQDGNTDTTKICQGDQKKGETVDSYETLVVGMKSFPKATINIDEPFPEGISPDKAEREAGEWLARILRDSIKIAEAKMKEARADGQTKRAALWDLRRARAVIALATVKD